MDFNNHPQVNTLSSTHNTALIKLIHEGHSLVESFAKLRKAYVKKHCKKELCIGTL